MNAWTVNTKFNHNRLQMQPAVQILCNLHTRVHIRVTQTCIIYNFPPQKRFQGSGSMDFTQYWASVPHYGHRNSFLFFSSDNYVFKQKMIAFSFQWKRSQRKEPKLNEYELLTHQLDKQVFTTFPVRHMPTHNLISLWQILHSTYCRSNHL